MKRISYLVLFAIGLLTVPIGSDSGVDNERFATYQQMSDDTVVFEVTAVTEEAPSFDLVFFDAEVPVEITVQSEGKYPETTQYRRDAPKLLAGFEKSIEHPPGSC